MSANTRSEETSASFHIAYRDYRGRHVYCLGTSGLSKEKAEVLLSDRRSNGEAFPGEYVAPDADLSSEDRRIAGREALYRPVHS